MANVPANVKKAEQQVAAAVKAAEAAVKNQQADSATYTPLSPLYPKTSTGRRRALAQWIANRDNPLTARVAVNHIWLRHFDRALVESVFDFGRNGKKPTHPELLDWLAVELTEHRWSMKHLHRLIVTSEVYRMQSAPTAARVAADPDNRLLSHFNARRMEGEAVRDSVLYLAGELDPRIGGAVLENNQEAGSHRRSLYFSTYPEEGGHLAFLESFDPPDPGECYRRTVSLLPQQALVLTNSRLLLDQSRLLARKLAPPDGNEEAFITAAFEQVLARPPSGPELSACREFLRKQADLFRAAKAPPGPGNPGVPPAADPVHRARESLVRVLFNHNDFLTVR
jgi:hypothetical protein